MNKLLLLLLSLFMLSCSTGNEEEVIKPTETVEVWINTNNGLNPSARVKNLTDETIRVQGILKYKRGSTIYTDNSKTYTIRSKETVSYVYAIYEFDSFEFEYVIK